MTSWLDWGIDVVLWVQQGSPTLDIPFVSSPFWEMSTSSCPSYRCCIGVWIDIPEPG